MRVNGVTTAPVDPGTRLLDHLRDDLGLTGSKEGCGMGECGSCTVLLDGRPVCSCLVLVGQVAGSDVTTVEGMAELEPGRRAQRAFVAEQAVQCGFCIAGMIVSTGALLAERPEPDDAELAAALEGNLCRCTGYGSIRRAIDAAVHEGPAA